MTCEYCDDGDGNCIYPYYGLAPHIHVLNTSGGYIGSTVFTGEVPDNFQPDRECPDDEPTHGVYTHCPHCGIAG